MRLLIYLVAAMAGAARLTAQTSPFVDEKTERALVNELSGDLALRAHASDDSVAQTVRLGGLLLSARKGKALSDRLRKNGSGRDSGEAGEALSAGAWYYGGCTPEMVEKFFETEARDGLITW
jgi:hypothetical protein